jgi:hypothetical protein
MKKQTQKFVSPISSRTFRQPLEPDTGDNMIRFVITSLALFFAGIFPVLANDFPTDARAEYVFACMATNGENREMLRRCSCSIDRIAEHLTYDEYVEAETVLRMRLMGGGEKATLFKETAWAKQIVDKLKQAQAEAELDCF